MVSVTIDRRDGLNSAAAIKGPCRVATTANITLTGLQTVDGVALAEGDRVLVKNQTDARDNGIRIASAGNWERSADFRNSRDVVTGTQVYVTHGTVSAERWYGVTTANPISIGTSSIAFTLSDNLAAAAAAADDAEASAAAINYRSYTTLAIAQAAEIPASVKRISTQFHTPNYAVPSTLAGGAHYRRVSLADLTGYPTQSYFRSVDRFMLDETTDVTNGGYWVIDEAEITPEMLGSLGNGDSANDDSAIITAAAQTMSLLGGGVVILPRKYYSNALISIAHDVRVMGVSKRRDAHLMYPAFADNDIDRSHLTGNGLIIRGPLSSFEIGMNSSLEGVRLVGEWCTVPPRSDLSAGSVLTKAMIAAWPNVTGVTIKGNDVTVENCTIIGFQLGVYSNGYERPRIVGNNIDSHNGIEVTACGDVAHVDGNQIFPFYPRDWPDSSGVVTQRPGRALYIHDVVDTAIIANNFSYGYAIGAHYHNVYALMPHANRHDNSFLGQQNYPLSNTVGVLTSGTINSCFIDASLCDGYYNAAKFTHTDGHLSCGTIHLASCLGVKMFIGKDASLSIDRVVCSGETTGALIEFEAVRTVEASIGEVVLAYFTGANNLVSLASSDVRKVRIGKIRRGGSGTDSTVNNFPPEEMVATFTAAPGADPVLVSGDGGISSAGRFSDGAYLINFAVDQPDVNYHVELSAQRSTSGHMICSLAGGATNAKNVNNVNVTFVNPSNALEAPALFTVMVRRT